MKNRVAIIGFGAIGKLVIQELSAKASQDFELALVQRTDGSSAAELPATVARLTGPDELVSWKPDLVAEAAGQGAVAAYGEVCLNQGIPFIITSTGAMADAAQRLRIEQAARYGKTHATIISGAIGSLDYVGAATRLPGVQLTYESRKPVAAWVNELKELGLDPDTLREPLVLFEGNAETAAQRYPKNLNVAATLALAGIGMQETRVRVVADPQATANNHIIHVKGPAGTLESRIVNAPSPENPKSSYIVGYSVLNAIHQHFSPLRFA